MHARVLPRYKVQTLLTCLNTVTPRRSSSNPVPPNSIIVTACFALRHACVNTREATCKELEVRRLVQYTTPLAHAFNSCRVKQKQSNSATDHLEGFFSPDARSVPLGVAAVTAHFLVHVSLLSRRDAVVPLLAFSEPRCKFWVLLFFIIIF